MSLAYTRIWVTNRSVPTQTHKVRSPLHKKNNPAQVVQTPWMTAIQCNVCYGVLMLYLLYWSYLLHSIYYWVTRNDSWQ